VIRAEHLAIGKRLPQRDEALAPRRGLCYFDGAAGLSAFAAQLPTRKRNEKGIVMNAYVYLGGAIALEVMATTAMKSSEGFTRLVPSLICGIGYVLSFYLLAQTLKTVPTGIAYAIWSGVGIVAISLIAWVLHGQKLDAGAMAGMGLIIAGVLVINLFSKSAGH